MLYSVDGKANLGISDIKHFICSIDHTILGAFPRSALCHNDALFDLQYLAELMTIRCKRQKLINKDRKKKGMNMEYHYAMGDDTLIINDHVYCTANDKKNGPFHFVQVNINEKVP